jgi:phosphatidylinositol alpha-mannosyltransferase
VEEEVQFIDYVDNSMRKAMLYKSSDLFVLPSNQESFGIVILEAMASGLPVVASAVGGITNLVKDGQTGLLVPPYNSDILAKAIIKLLGNPELIQKLSEEGKKQVQNYSWSEIADKTEEIYQEVAG